MISSIDNVPYRIEKLRLRRYLVFHLSSSDPLQFPSVPCDSHEAVAASRRVECYVHLGQKINHLRPGSNIRPSNAVIPLGEIGEILRIRENYLK